MKKKIGILFLVILVLTGNILAFADNVVAGTGVKEDYVLRIKEIETRKKPEDIINGLKLLKLQVDNDINLSQVDKLNLNTQIDNAIKRATNGNKDKSPYTKDELQKLTKVNYDGRSFSIYLPGLGRGQEYEYELYREKAIVSKGNTVGIIELPKITKEETFELRLLIIDVDYTVLLDTMVNVTIKDIVMPDLDYAYVEDGEVFLSFKDNYVLDGIFQYNRSNEGKKLEVTNNSFRVDIPSDIEIIIVSPFKKETLFKLKVDRDNSVIHGTVDLSIENRLKNKRIVSLDKYKSIQNLFVGYKGKTIDLRKESERLVFEKYGRTNKEDITFTSSGIKIDDSFGDLTKPGLNTVKIQHSFYTNEDLTFFVYVREDDRIYNTNIDKIEIKGTMITKQDSFTARTYIDAKQKIDGYSPVLDFIFILKDNMAYSIDTEIKLEKNKINTFTIIDVLTGKEYLLNLKYEDEPTNNSNNVSFNDVKGSHWAYHDIKDLAFAGLAKGYDDGSYRPDNNITIKEFMVLLNRFTNNVTGLSVGNFKNNLGIPLATDDWAYMDVLAVYKRIDFKDLDKLSVNNLNKNITRGEVAFLVDTSLKLEKVENISDFKDISNSIHKEHINNLSSSKIINGYTNGTFKPEGNITRAEVSSILNKLLKTSKGETINE